MGDYEDRYPEAYGRGEDPELSTAEELKQAQTSRQTRDKVSAGLRQRLGLGGPAEAAPRSAQRVGWRHGQAGEAEPIEPVRIIEPTATPGVASLGAGNFRGIGPRGYVRSPARIYEDICDRLTENPFIDASDIDIAVNGVEVTLRGNVDSVEAARQVEAIAQETAGVTRVRNELTLRHIGRRSEPTAGEQVNRSIGVPRR